MACELRYTKLETDIAKSVWRQILASDSAGLAKVTSALGIPQGSEEGTLNTRGMIDDALEREGLRQSTSNTIPFRFNSPPCKEVSCG